MTIAIGQHTLAGASPFSNVATLVTGAIATSVSGSIFAASVNDGAGGIASVLDSFSNLYLLKESGSQFGLTGAIYTCDGGTGGSGHTATLNVNTAANILIALTEVTGGANPSFDAGNSGNTSGPGATQTGAAVTTTNAADLILSMLALPGIGSGTVVTDSGSGFSIVDQLIGSSQSGMAVSSAVKSATGTYQDTYAVSGGTFVGAYAAFATVALKAGGAGAPYVPENQLFRGQMNALLVN